MPTYIEMPKLADTMTEGAVARWLVKEGDKISSEQELAEIETDKATQSFTSYDAGVLHKILVPAGQKVACGTPIAILLGKNEKPPADDAAPPAAAKPAKAEAAPASASAPASSPAAPAKAAAPAARTPGARVKASPLAKKIAAAQGVDLARLAGTGPGGRIVARDVQSAPAGGATAAPAIKPIAATPAGPGDQRIPLTNMRRIIA